jgi:hypothetical protein
MTPSLWAVLALATVVHLGLCVLIVHVDLAGQKGT